MYSLTLSIPQPELEMVSYLHFNPLCSQSGNQFYEGVYNETVNIIELEEGLDGETFFLYLFLGACGVLLLVVGQQVGPTVQALTPRTNSSS